MQIVIDIVDIKILWWTVHIETQCVIVQYQLIKSDGQPYETRTATFWVILPTGEQLPYWYLLPAEYVATLTSLTEDAYATLLSTIQ